MRIEKTNPLAFSDVEYSERLARVKSRMKERGLEAVLICIPQNYYYLTGYYSGGTHSLLFLILPLTGDPLWVTRKTEMSNVRALAPYMWAKEGVGVGDSEDQIHVLAASLKEMGLEKARIGVEKDALFFTINQYEDLIRRMPDAELIDVTGMIEHERRVKSPTELDYMRKAGFITSRAIEASFNALDEGVTDSELVAVMLAESIRQGSDRQGTLPYLAAGPRTYRAHASWTGEPIGRGEIVNAEMAATWKFYSVPLFRVFSVGHPSEEVRRMQAASEAGLHAGLENIRAGMTSHEADKVVRDAITKTGYGENFVVRAAYGLGTAFAPGWGESSVMAIKPQDERVLEPGMCFHLVPAIYVEGTGCVCCSMPLVITEAGIEPLSDLEPKLFVK